MILIRTIETNFQRLVNQHVESTVSQQAQDTKHTKTDI